MSDHDDSLVPETPSPVFGKRKLKLMSNKNTLNSDQNYKLAMSKKLCYENTLSTQKMVPDAPDNFEISEQLDKAQPRTEPRSLDLYGSTREKVSKLPRKTKNKNDKFIKILKDLSFTDSEGSDVESGDAVRAENHTVSSARNTLQDGGAAAMNTGHLSSNDADDTDSFYLLKAMQKSQKSEPKAKKEVPRKQENQLQEKIDLEKKYNADLFDCMTDDTSQEVLERQNSKRRKLRPISSSDDSSDDTEVLLNPIFPVSSRPQQQETVETQNTSIDQVSPQARPFIDLSQESDEQTSSDIDEDDLDVFLNTAKNHSVPKVSAPKSGDKNKMSVEASNSQSAVLDISSPHVLGSETGNDSVQLCIDYRGPSENVPKKHHSGHKGHRGESHSKSTRHKDFRPASSLLSSSPDAGAASSPDVPGAKPARSLRERRTKKTPGGTSNVKVRKPSGRSATSRQRSQAVSNGATRTPCRWSNTSQDSHPTQAGEESTMAVVGMLEQLDQDERLARQLQEEMDLQFAERLASTATPTHEQRSRRSPSHSAARGRHIDVDRQEVVASIIGLSEWQWQVHLALFRGLDLPDPPQEHSYQLIEEVFNADILEFLHSHPEVAVDQQDMAVARLTAGNSPRVHTGMDRHSGERDHRPRRQAAAAPNTMPPVVIGETRRRGTNSNAVMTRSRNARRPREANSRGVINGIRGQLLGPFGLFEDEVQHLLDTFQVPGPRGRAGRRPGMPNIFERDDGNDYEELLDLAEQIGSVLTEPGLSAEQISRLPMKRFDAGELNPGAESPECLVCMSEYQNGDQQRILTCFHTFHCSCIDKWIKQNPTCPVCRNRVVV